MSARLERDVEGCLTAGSQKGCVVFGLQKGRELYDVQESLRC